MCDCTWVFTYAMNKHSLRIFNWIIHVYIYIYIYMCVCVCVCVCVRVCSLKHKTYIKKYDLALKGIYMNCDL